MSDFLHCHFKVFRAALFALVFFSLVSCDIVPVATNNYTDGGSGTSSTRGAARFSFSSSRTSGGGLFSNRSYVDVSFSSLGQLSQHASGGNYGSLYYSNVLPGTYTYSIYEYVWDNGTSVGYVYNSSGPSYGYAGNTGFVGYRKHFVVTRSVEIQAGKTVTININW